jgi:hypothetical protein
MIPLTLRLFTVLTAGIAAVRTNTSRLRTTPQQGGHAVEYAIGVGGSLLVMGLIIIALRTGIAAQIGTWVFGTP